MGHTRTTATCRCALDGAPCYGHPETGATSPDGTLIARRRRGFASGAGVGIVKTGRERRDAARSPRSGQLGHRRSRPTAARSRHRQLRPQRCGCGTWRAGEARACCRGTSGRCGAVAWVQRPDRGGLRLRATGRCAHVDAARRAGAGCRGGPRPKLRAGVTHRGDRRLRSLATRKAAVAATCRLPDRPRRRGDPLRVAGLPDLGLCTADVAARSGEATGLVGDAYGVVVDVAGGSGSGACGSCRR